MQFSNFVVFLALSAACTVAVPNPSSGALTPSTTPYQNVTLASGLVATGDATILILGSTTLVPGTGEHTIGQHTISFGSSRVVDVDGTTTELLPPRSDTTSRPSNSTTPTITPST